jgi:hypothetical protein
MKAIKTKFHAPGNVLGSRVSASAEGHNRVVLSWDHSLDTTENHAAAAKALCKKMHWYGKLIMGSLTDSYVFVFVPTHPDYPKAIIVEEPCTK